MPAKELSPLHARLTELGITPAELDQLVSRSEEEVASWISADELAGDAKILCRFLADDVDTGRRLEHLRKTYRRSLGASDAVVLGGAPSSVPYAGGYTGKTGGMVK